MRKLTLIGAVGRPHGEVGRLIPVIRDDKNRCFQIGGAPELGFSSTALKEYVKEGALLPFKPVRLPPHEWKLSVDNLLEVSDPRLKLNAPAHVFYFSEAARSELDMSEQYFVTICTKSQGIQLNVKSELAKKWKGFAFYLFSREPLVDGFLPSMFSWTVEKLKNYLKSRLESGCLVRSEEDVSDRLASFLSTIAFNSQSAEIAIRYWGLIILLGPYARNFDAWLECALADWQFPLTDADFWWEQCWGMLRGILRDIAAEKFEKEYQKLRAEAIAEELLKSLGADKAKRRQNFEHSPLESLMLELNPKKINWRIPISQFTNPSIDVGIQLLEPRDIGL